MLRLLLVAGVAASGAWWYKKHHSVSAPAALTPARAAVHGRLMTREFRPDTLDQMAGVFGQEGLPEHAKALAFKASQIRKQARAAEELVERARACDQNAMGLIAAIRQQAEAGSPRAQVSRALLARYCAKHPMPSLGPMGEMPVADEAAA